MELDQIAGRGKDRTSLERTLVQERKREFYRESVLQREKETFFFCGEMRVVETFF